MAVVYGGVAAVSSVSLSVEPGEIVGLIGANGAGKTSLIDGATGYARTCRGRVLFDGRPVDSWPPHERARAGLIRTFQQLELFDDLSVADNLAVAAASNPHGSSALAERALKSLDLIDIADCRVTEVSAGRRRLVAVARALAAGPRVLLLDEPAAGLDSEESEELATRLVELASDGHGILLVDHDMTLVFSICERIIALDFGEQIAEGTPAEIRENPAVLRAYLGEAE